MQNEHKGFGGRQGWSRVGGNLWPQGSIKSKYFESVSDSKNTSKYYLFGLLPNVKKPHLILSVYYTENIVLSILHEVE